MNRSKIVAGITAAGLLAGGAATMAATAASASAATVMSYKAPVADPLTLTFGSNTYTYNVNLHEQYVSPGVELISGTLRDTYEPSAISLPVHGVQFGKDVVLSVQYPATGTDAGSQGLRTFSGTIGAGGKVTGVWDETGAEAGSGTFTLARV